MRHFQKPSCTIRFVRKGVAGDWRNHFQERHMAAFDKAAGEALEALGYSW